MAFDDEVLDAANAIKRRMRKVASESISDVLRAAQRETRGKMLGGTVVEGYMPIFERDLVESLESTRNGGETVRGRDSFEPILADLELGDTFSFEWTEPYAMLVHEGFTDFDGEIRRQDGGWQWVGANAPKFSGFVEANAEIYK